jgi:hypothetical protein
MTTKYLMTDIETMDTEPSAAIVSLGACIFDPHGEGPIDTFYRAISLEDNVKRGRTMSAGTVLWWMQQSDSARQALVKDVTNLHGALVEFSLWVAGHNPCRSWANDPDFDYVILSHAMRSLNVLVPWKFWETRSMRTIKDLSHPEGDFPDFTGDGVAHNAMDDAIKQAIGVQYAHAKLGI